MDRKITSRDALSPGDSDSLAAAIKNDSFLEDMELFSHDTNFYLLEKDGEQHVTKRTQSPSVLPFSKIMEAQDELFEQNVASVKTSAALATTRRRSSRQDIENTDKFQSGNNNVKKQGTGSKEVKLKTQDNKSKIQENKVKPKMVDFKQQYDKKSVVKDRRRGSEISKDTDQNGEASKENKQPSNLPKQTSSPLETVKDQQRKSDVVKKLDAKEIPESVALLSAVKEVVRTYTKEEGMRVLRALNELHILSQASLIKNLMFQTDQIRKDLQLGENLGELKVLMAENDRLKETCSLLKVRNEDLKKRLEETERIKEENASLKLKLQEFTGRNVN